MASITLSNMTTHVKPRFVVNGTIDTTNGKFTNVTISQPESGAFGYHLATYLYKGGIPGSGGTKLATVHVLPQGSLGHAGASHSKSGTFTACPSDKVYFVQMCQCNESNDNSGVPCDMSEGNQYKSATVTPYSTTYNTNFPYPSKNVMAAVVPDDFPDEGGVFTALCYMVQDEEELPDYYNPGTLTLTASRSGGTTINATAKYTRDDTPAYWGAKNTTTNQDSSNKHKILLQLFQGSTQIGSDKLVATDAAGGSSSTSWTGVDLTTAYTVKAYIVEKLSSDGTRGVLSKSKSVAAGTGSGGTLTVTGSRSGTTINATAKYTKQDAYAYWATDNEANHPSGSDNKILLRLYKAGTTTKIGSDKLVSTNGAGGDSNATWTSSDGVDLTTAYYIAASIAEQLSADGNTKGLLTASANINAGNANPGTLTVSASRAGDGTTINATAKYTKQDAYAYWATDNEANHPSGSDNKILLRLYNGTSQVGTDKTPNTNAAGGDSNATWTGISATTTYNVVASIAEQLSADGATKGLLYTGANVAAYAAPGSIKVEAVRNGDKITVKGTHTGDAKIWGARTQSTTENTTNTNKVCLTIVAKGGDFTSSSSYAYVNSGGSYDFTADKYTSYDCYASCNENVGGSNVSLLKDMVNIEAEAVPLEPAYCEGMNAIITGTTVSLQPVFHFGTIKTIEWTAKLGRIINSGSNSSWVKFELLANQTTYTIVFHGLNQGAANTDENLTDSQGRKVEVTTDSALIEFAKADVSYDCMTYGCTVQQFAVDRNKFEGRLFQTQGAHGETYHMLTQCGVKGFAGFCRARSGSSIGNTNVGTVSISDHNITVTGLKPSTSYRLYIYLTDCKDFNGDFDAVNYIDFTTEAVAVAGTFQARVTGKTITITPNITRWNNSESIAWRAYIHTGSYSGPTVTQVTQLSTRTQLPSITATGLQNGTKYYITFEAFDEMNNPLNIDGIEVVTYGIVLTLGTPYTRSIKQNSIKYTEGEKASATVQDSSRGSAVKYFVSNVATDTIIIDPTTVNCRRTNPNIFDTEPSTALNPVTTYRMTAYIEGVEYEGTNDTVVEADFTTKRAPSNLAVTTEATGETIRVTPTWTAATSSNNEVLVSVALYAEGMLIEVKTTTITNTDLWFTGLARGTEHIIVFVGEDNEGNTMDDFFTYAAGTNGVTTELTYKLTFSNQSKSTRSAQWVCTSNRRLPTGKVIEYEVLEGESVKMDWTGTMNSGGTARYINFHMTTPYCIRVRIQDMLDRNGAHDTVEEYFDVTLTLTLEFDDYTPHVLVLDTRWQAFASGNEYNIDPISGVPIAFIPEKIEIWPVRKGKGKVGTNYGVYYPNRYRYFTGLTGGREYHIVMWVTDGINEATAEIELWTLIELIRIYSEIDRRWYHVLPYVYTNTIDLEGKEPGTYNWVPAPCYLYSRNAWRHTQPE